MKSIRLIQILSILALIPLAAHGAAYVKFEGIEGEANDRDHKDWSAIHSVAQNSERSAATEPGTPQGRDMATGMATGRRQPKPITISKPIDKSSPMLARALVSGASIGTVRIRQDNGASKETLILSDVTVASIGGTPPTEEVTLNFEKIKTENVSKVQVRGWDPKK